ncbi:putative repeat protein (TIGR01451 family) [Alkalibaculum bacchi]|uniref:Putative repeat protein (TIGR01451 family) n=1 Tax=Alkalibaculum bacchi TaxID=645887 RepID=A0A366I6Z0_9FIRM|nr:DUF5979 domain-containing protein [Alkalibaculum bacchi]RBP64487.1 putative repeat protein (TIGR01451 family) [Alkalibaculum bacchi]
MRSKGKKRKFSLFMVFVLLFSLLASSLVVMAETVDSNLEMNSVNVSEEELTLTGLLSEGPKVEQLVEEPKVEQLVEEPKVDLPAEEPKVETPTEEPKDESPAEEPKVETPTEEPKGEAPIEEPEGDIVEKTVEVAPVSDDDTPIRDANTNKESAPLTEVLTVAPMAVGPIPIVNYFAATGSSTNDHYSVVGVYITPDNNIHLLIDNDKNTANQTRFYDPMLNGVAAAGYGLTPQNYDPYWKELGNSVTLTSPGNPDRVITGVRLFTFNLGPMMGSLKESNTLQILNSADGFSIRGLTFTINMGHTITKTVDKANATIGDELIYTIAVKNTGDFILRGINVTDTIPSGTTVLKVSKDNGATWVDPVIAGNVITLDTNIDLVAGASKTYKVKAFINDNVTNGQTLDNTVATGGNVPTQTATARVTVKTANVTVKKIITGNFGEVSREFPFTVKANKNGGHYTEKTFDFHLHHNETHTIPNLPTDAVLALTEVNGDYVVTVTVDGNPITPVTDVYTINVGSMATKTITVTNEKNVVIDTGISLDSLPYVLILVFTVVGLGVMVIRKRNIHN